MHPLTVLIERDNTAEDHLNPFHCEWYNKPENQARVRKAIRLIRKQRERLGL